MLERPGELSGVFLGALSEEALQGDSFVGVRDILGDHGGSVLRLADRAADGTLFVVGIAHVQRAAR